MIRQGQQWLIPVAVYLLLVIIPVHADSHFPALSGRVVDHASMLDQALEQRLTGLLKAHEYATTNQVVIVTLPNLGGYDIETYGYQLGRHWQIGQKDKDNGVLLIVAKKERKVRIEVGYGLEGTLTDAISSNIINSVILPEFKKARFAIGIEHGSAAIVQALGGEYEIKKGKNGRGTTNFFIILIVLLIFFGLQHFGGSSPGSGGRGRHYGHGGGRTGGGSFGGGGGGGFSGGGGGFGGGGASGGW